MILHCMCPVLESDQLSCEILEGEQAFLEECGEELDMGDTCHRNTED